MHASEAYETKKTTKENDTTMPHKPCLHAIDTIFCMSAICEYGACNNSFISCSVKQGK